MDDELQLKLGRFDHDERLQSCTQALYDRVEQLADAMRQIQQWSEAYPLDIFPEPDWKRAHAVLKEHDMTLDAIAAGVMRRALVSVNKIASEALTMAVPEPPLEDGAGDVDQRPAEEGERDDQGDDIDGHAP